MNNCSPAIKAALNLHQSLPLALEIEQEVLKIKIMKNNMLWMMLGCFGIAILFFFLPLVAVTASVSKLVYAVAIVACAASIWFMMRSSPKSE